MSCRSQSDAYKSALTDRFIDTTNSKPFDIHNAEVFKDQPLQDPSTELRYLYLLPKRHNINLDGQTVLRCELLSDAEEQTPHYIGLSYTWGDPEIRRPMLVGDKVFHATENLAIALEHLQEEDKTIIFWIDAVCINQNDSNEKSIQVQRMGSIFASAVLVIAWIGPAADDSDLALQELESYAAEFIQDSWSQFRQVYAKRFAALHVESIEALLVRSWFKRVWVGQEVALNEQVIFVCGQRDILREKLLECCLLFSQSLVLWRGDMICADFFRFDYVQALTWRDFVKHTIANLFLFYGSALESSDPRDFVYSSFGRINNIKECGLHVDYTTSVEVVYTEFAEAIIRAGEIDMLSNVWRPSSTYKNLPSWVPDWSDTYLCGYPENASMLEKDIVEICNVGRGDKALKISARRLARVGRIENELQIQRDIRDLNPAKLALVTIQEEEGVMCFLNTIQRALSRKERWRPEEVEKALFNLSTGMSLAKDLLEDQEDVVDDLSISYRAFRGLITPPDDILNPQAWRKDASHAYLNILRDSKIENFFVTSIDIVGVSRDGVQPGDWVYVLGGVEGAWVLREAGEGYHRIVSIASIFPWEDLENNDAPIEVLTII
ncbi:uncharacterized protein ALTATR162_LOCUS4673 [Alternaria atra]|uniref:Heterokaryon incompatibility domain-containing protein n=1 Tax=Alternaria atra TaxID=119953 RepID=A0A8J2N599_9PLEO|nr:uncharacterized protein ALTATR162_LOCUS4673 [Alternaria atra]CAG5156880.1 unnamed protein product [Alternaria atra]